MKLYPSLQAYERSKLSSSPLAGNESKWTPSPIRYVVGGSFEEKKGFYTPALRLMVAKVTSGVEQAPGSGQIPGVERDGSATKLPQAGLITTSQSSHFKQRRESDSRAGEWTAKPS